ncbi:MAG: hypothetical protein ACRC6O_13205 [Flavobacterium sp.]
MSTLNSSGLTIDSLADLIAKFTASYESIYGLDINLDSNSPDGQMMNIYALQAEDILQLVQGIYNDFDPDTAAGLAQDRLYYLNGLIRKGASYSYLDVAIVTNRALTLQGLDASADLPNGTGYTVKDNTGTQWILLSSQSPVAAGTYTYSFRAQNLGVVNSSPSTVTLPVSVILGVVSINNPSSAVTVGAAGELDAAFRLRRSRSYAIRATGSADSMFANISNLPSVVDCKVYQNFTNATDADGIPAKSIWVIVDGGSNADIAQQIYAQHGYGDMKGSVTYNITTIQNQIFTARFDRPIAEDLYLKFNLKPTRAGQTFDLTAIANFISSSVVNDNVYQIGSFADTANLTYISSLAIIAQGNQAVPLDVFISNDGVTWTDYLDTTSVQHKFVLDAGNIAITEV